MTTPKLVWRVAPAPTYRAFQTRGWPAATYAATDDIAVAVFPEDGSAYSPRAVKTGAHGALQIHIADYRPRSGGGGFTWRVLKVRAATLAEAKTLALTFLRTHPDWYPARMRGEPAGALYGTPRLLLTPVTLGTSCTFCPLPAVVEVQTHPEARFGGTTLVRFCGPCRAEFARKTRAGA